MIRLLSLSGSPVVGSSTELLLKAISNSLLKNFRPSEKVDHTFVKLNDLKFLPCQACGEAPTPSFCFYDDNLTPLYEKLASCDCLIFGSPVYFDSVSAQSKAFIDRCNCFRPADFNNTDPAHNFIRLIKRKRAGAIVLVGGEDGWFEGARRCLAGFFKWIEVVNEGLITFRSSDFKRIGSVSSDEDTLDQAERLGQHLARMVESGYERP